MKGIKNHNQTNRLIKWTVIAFDFVALWLLLPLIAIIIKRQSPGPVFFRRLTAKTIFKRDEKAY